MARETAKERRKRVREQVSVHRERNKDRESLLAAIAVAAPDGLEQHMSFKFETVKGKTHIVCTLTQEGAVFINDFAAKLGGESGIRDKPQGRGARA